jgi:hypothetical protein
MTFERPTFNTSTRVVLQRDKVEQYTTAARPDFADVEVGTEIFDTTLGKPVWSDGTAWVDSTGTPA